MVMLFYVTADGQLGMATYGKTRVLCDTAREFGEVALKALREIK